MRQIEHWVQESVNRRFPRKAARHRRRRGQLRARPEQVYLTIVWDHQAGHVVWIGKGKDQDTLEQFFEKLGPRRCCRLVAITTEMAHGYINAAHEYAP